MPNPTKIDIFVISKLWTDSMTSMREDSYGYSYIYYVLSEEEAKNIVKEGGKHPIDYGVDIYEEKDIFTYIRVPPNA